MEGYFLINKKSQVFSLDLLFSIIILIFILLGSFWTWNYAQGRIQEIHSMKSLQLTTQNTVNELVRQPGIPVDWQFHNNLSNISAFGLADQSINYANQEKIDKLIMYGNNFYQESRQKLHIGKYNYFLTIGANSTGLFPNESSNIISMEDVMLLDNGTIIKVELRLWT